MMGLENYKITSALMQGISYQKSNTGCEDALLVTKMDQCIFLGLADGAGSKKHAYEASWLVLYLLRLEFEKKLDQYLDSKDIAKKILAYIEQSLNIMAIFSKLDFKELSSTLIFALILEDEYILGHIGDGMVINVLEDNQLNILSYPENFEFANETLFCNSTKYENRLRIYRGYSKDINNGLLLCTDGGVKMLFMIIRMIQS